MTDLDRRSFLKGSILAAGLAGCAGTKPIVSPSADGLVDTNVSVMAWPFRRLKYERTESLVAKLRRHRIREAWTGSYEALFHNNIAHVNSRLSEECNSRG